jgi:hypothetical protein
MPKFFRLTFLISLLFLPTAVQADPVALTIVGGTIIAGRGTLPNGISFGAGVSIDLIGVDPLTGTMHSIFAAAEGAFSTNQSFLGPGEIVTFTAGTTGNADFGFAIINISFSGSGPPIPNVIQPTLDLVGSGTATISGMFFANSMDADQGQNPIFTVSPQSFSGPVALHFIAFAAGDPRFELRNATLTIPQPVPEPASLILLLTSVAGLGLLRRRT